MDKHYRLGEFDHRAVMITVFDEMNGGIQKHDDMPEWFRADLPFVFRPLSVNANRYYRVSGVCHRANCVFDYLDGNYLPVFTRTQFLYQCQDQHGYDAEHKSTPDESWWPIGAANYSERQSHLESPWFWMCILAAVAVILSSVFAVKTAASRNTISSQEQISK